MRCCLFKAKNYLKVKGGEASVINNFLKQENRVGRATKLVKERRKNA